MLKVLYGTKDKITSVFKSSYLTITVHLNALEGLA